MMGGGGGMMGGAGGRGVRVAAGDAAERAPTSPCRARPSSSTGSRWRTAEIYAPKGARAAAEDAYQSALTRNLVIAAAIAGVLALLVSLLVSRRITGPLEELTDAAGDVSAGNLDVRVAPRGDDEVAALAAAFNAMADRLARDEQWRRDMTSDLSHELRTPLATIQSRVEALEDGVLPPTPENLRVIGEEVERLGRLLGALRSLNELESEDLSVEHEPVDLAEVAAAAADRHRPAFLDQGRRAHGGAAAGRRAGRPRPAAAGGREPARQRAQVHAGRRARRPRRGRRGRAGTSRPAAPWRGPPAPSVRLTVTDDGPGVDPVDLPFVFDRFYRAQETRGTSGAGLGLAICRALVEAQGGSIAADERPGRRRPVHRAAAGRRTRLRHAVAAPVTSVARAASCSPATWTGRCSTTRRRPSRAPARRSPS